MELLLRVHPGPADRPARSDPSRSLDVAVEIDADDAVERLAIALARAVHTDAGPWSPGRTIPALFLVRTGALLPAAAAVASTGLVSGDEVIVGDGTSGDDALVRAASIGPPGPPIRGVSVDVLAGPDSGHSAVLGRGTYVLGRDDGADLVFGDRSVSRRHLRVEVGADWTVTVAPCGEPQNGVLVNDRDVAASTVVGPDDVVALGATRIALREFIRSETESVDRLGQIEFHRTPHRPHVVRPRSLPPLGPIPARPEARRFQALSVLAPLAAGLVLFAFSRQVQFLAIIAISPLVMVGNWFEDRRTGRRRTADDIVAFEARCAGYRRAIDEALAAERVERVRATPDLADLARRAELRTIDLWPRGRDDGDFLAVRVGLGDCRSLVSASLATGGDADLRDDANALLDGHDVLRDVPVVVALADTAVVAVHGPPEVVDDVAASILVQVACLHSPEDLVIAAVTASDRPPAGWLKWLPHIRSVTSPLAGAHVTTDADSGRRLLAELVEVVERRIAEQAPTGTPGGRRSWPHLLVILDGDLDLDATLVSQLLERSGDAGVSVVWLSTSEAKVPRQARAVIDCAPPQEMGFARLWSTDPDQDDQVVELGQVNAEVADRVACSLAAVRDASVATATTAIPRVVPLLSVLGTEVPDADWVLDRWAGATTTVRPHGLSHPIGVGPDGVLHVDLVADGPHALIGGTSGAGKSELLQSMVASLVTCHPPTRLNLLFVDYKGGASSTVFRDIPHTVGYVTNLDAALSRRALTSLRAELERRMRLLEGRAKDLAEMLERHPADAPPSLVIVVDEFATLVKEIPDFVAGIVDIAQRGRSLGIHLVLATQRPSGSVNDNILANTNLRVSLRMLDAADSTAVVASPDAAAIPVPLRGRGFARLGPHDLVPFQSAYAGAPLTAATGRMTVTVRSFDPSGPAGVVAVDTGGDGRGDVATSDTGDRTHLDAVLDAVGDAARRSGLTPGRPPWQETLPVHLTLDDLTRDPRASAPADQAGRTIAIGLVDVPEDQDQYPVAVDLEDGGGLLVFGAGGSGKTTLLRTAVVSTVRAAEPDGVIVFGIDFASRSLTGIAALPEVACVASGDDLEAVSRVVALLDAELDRRRTLLAEHGAETLTAHRSAGSPGGTLPRVLLVVDGYANLVASLTGGSGGGHGGLDRWLDTLHRIVIDGRQVGIHSILAAERRAGVPALVHSAIGNRIVLRQADPSGYAELGVPLSVAGDVDLAPGRGLWQNRHLVQIACVSADADGKAQTAAIAAEATVRPDRSGSGGCPDSHDRLRCGPLPPTVAVDGLITDSPAGVPLGLADLTLAPVAIDVEHSHVLITGVPRSGRSTALATIGAGLTRLGHECWTVGPATSPLAVGADPVRSVFGRAAALAPVLDELADAVTSSGGGGPAAALGAATPPGCVLLVDDLDALDDPALTASWERLAGVDGLRVVAAIETRNASGFSMHPMLTSVRSARRLLVLQPDDPMELFQLTGVKTPVRPGTPLPPGRGVVLVDRVPTVVQVAVTARPGRRRPTAGAAHPKIDLKPPTDQNPHIGRNNGQTIDTRSTT